jgi:hypothetical protein
MRHSMLARLLIREAGAKAVKRSLRIGRRFPPDSLEVCEKRILKSQSRADGGELSGKFRD